MDQMRVIGYLIDRGPITIADFVTDVLRPESYDYRIAYSGVSSKLSILRAQGYVQVVGHAPGARGQTAALWAVTDDGRILYERSMEAKA